MREWFMEQWQSSSVIQGSMALACTLTMCYLFVVGREVPQILVGIVGTILGFYFRTKRDQDSD